jgi:tetratricopeptide (TPR) repeat protein/transcriptional regulator with XRE-family HTH domain
MDTQRDYDFGQSMLTLRNEIGLTQERMGSLLGVTTRTVVGWEAGSSYPKIKHLKQLIELAVQHQAFPKGSEAEEIRRLWNAARQKVRINEHWLSTLLAGQDDQRPQMGTHAEEESGQNRKDGDGPLSVPTLQNLPFPPNPFFTGRESELAHLGTLFEQSARIAITQPISVSGLGGIGKTQLALEYAHRCYPSVYRSVLWVNAADKASLEASYLSLAHLLKLPEEQEREIDRTVQAVDIWLEQHTHWLLILDNADDLQLARSFLPSKPRGHILLTTRSQIVGDMATLLQVEAMPPQEGLHFLLRRSGYLKPDVSLNTVTDAIRREAEVLVELLVGHPLALDQAGAYVEETTDASGGDIGASFTRYRELYEQQSHFLLESRGSLGSRHPESVAKTFGISFQKACELHPRCAEVLAFCSLLHPDAIPEEMLCQEMGLDLLNLNEVIRSLRRYSLIKCNPGKKEISVHRLVQAVIRESMETQKFRRWATRVVQALNGAFPESDFKQWSRCEQLLPHVQLCAIWIERCSIAEAEAGPLLHKAGTYLLERGQYTDAQPLLVQALAIREQHLGTSHPDTARSLNNLALLYKRQGKYEQAEPLYLRALAIFEQHLGTSHPVTATGLNNLANLYWLQGKYEQAEPLYQRALAMREQHLGAEHPDTASSLDNLANLYKDQGKYEQAEPLHQRALAIREQYLGASHPDIAQSLNNLAILYRQQGRYEQAEPLHQRALAIREQYLGVSHPDTAKDLHNLAGLYREQGRYEQAEPLYQRALSMREQGLGASHPETADSLYELALLYQKLGKYDQAESLHRRALAIREQHLGASHPDTADSLYGLAELYREQGRYGQAEPLYQRVLQVREQYLGTEHPDTAGSLHGLAELYQEQGKYEQAEPLYQRALYIREKRLGPNHPQTQETREAYTAFIRNKGVS